MKIPHGGRERLGLPGAVTDRRPVRCRVALLAFLLAAPAWAATITVTTIDDELNVDDDCSLREAIWSANADSGFDTCTAGSGADEIVVPAGPYALTIPGSGEDEAATGDLDITQSVTITGAGADETVIGYGIADRIFHVKAPVNVSVAVVMSGITISEGTCPGPCQGGGILHQPSNVPSSLRLSDSKLILNNAGLDGGGIYAGAGSTLTLTGVAFTANKAGRDGGGVFYSGCSQVLTIAGCTFIRNEAGLATGGLGGGLDAACGSPTTTAMVTGTRFAGNSATSGGGIANSVTMALVDSTVDRNSATTTGGGGIYNLSSLITVTGSTVSRNTAGGPGGGILATGTLYFVNSTVSGNRSNGGGGGLYLTSASASLNNVTITENVADDDASSGLVDDGGGLILLESTCSLGSTIIAGNVDRGGEVPDCGGQLTSQGYNLIADNAGCSLSGTHTGNVIGEPADLAPLADNGGPTETHALLTGSLAIDAGNPAAPGSGGTACAATDQRGVMRPVGTACDIGAFEGSVSPPTTTSVTTTSSTSSSTTTSSTTSIPPTTTTSSTTSTSTVPVTSTTLPAGCPGGVTFTSVNCRLRELQSLVQSATDLAQFQQRLVAHVAKAKEHKEKAEGRCAEGKSSSARSALRRALVRLGKFSGALRSRGARRVIPAATREALLAAVEPIRDDVLELKRTLACPS